MIDIDLTAFVKEYASSIYNLQITCLLQSNNHNVNDILNSHQNAITNQKHALILNGMHVL